MSEKKEEFTLSKLPYLTSEKERQKKLEEKLENLMYCILYDEETERIIRERRIKDFPRYRFFS